MSSTRRRWLLSVLIAILAIGTIVLTLLALDRVRARTTDRDVAPVPTFSQPAPQTSSSPTPTPTPTPTSASAASYDRSQERFLVASADVLWRGTAGECGAAEPLLERSADGGETWTDFTPHYLGIGQLVALNPFADGQAEIIALMGDDCEVQALRTFTQGQFWESYPDVLAASRYVDPANPGTIVRPDSSIAAPCHDARSLRTAGPVIVTVCDGTAYQLDPDAEWLALPPTNVAAVNFVDDDIVVAHVSDRCTGVILTRYASAEDETSQDAECAEVAEIGVPTVIAASGENLLVWSGPTMAALPH